MGAVLYAGLGRRSWRWVSMLSTRLDRRTELETLLHQVQNGPGIESAAGIKLYLAPNDKKTAEEVSASLGKTTKLSVSDSLSRAMVSRRSRSSTVVDRLLTFGSPDEVVEKLHQFRDETGPFNHLIYAGHDGRAPLDGVDGRESLPTLRLMGSS
ncbi:hypothetical protein DPM13_15210 [Paracoccus mutanolyticus]|uniref:TraD/TraG TraM recognition site domain-containing protein n=1 Tax=Paracoccus mutanolyticus TaxID=1499308 RepID=A0ABM6WTJ4_9RHOB|nr:TraM recognition domain-containing protein [Paracoccus mutanolyticus]AWX93900.1 hypothetical protein DPM13_15210 [Paracoccus mutanolyticus]